MIADFWTTRCPRCPAALDALDERAAHMKMTGAATKYHSTNIYSICCGESTELARRIIQQGDLCEPQWTYISHYYMDTASKEIAKRHLGFDFVPFFVFVNPQGHIVQMGYKTIDWSILQVPEQPPSVTTTMMMDAGDNDNKAAPSVSPTSAAEPVFEIDDMDF